MKAGPDRKYTVEFREAAVWQVLDHRRLHTTVFLALLLIMLGVGCFRPALTDNEAVDLIPGVMLWDPSAFAGDWSFRNSDPSAALFDRVVAALLHLCSPIVLVLVGRATLGSTILYLLWRLSRRVGIGAEALFAGLCAWYVLGQTTLAGEQVLQDFEPKVWSYAFLLAALVAHLERRRIAGAIFLALAYVWHPFVGFWGGGSLLAALATERRWEGLLPSLLAFVLISLLFGALFLSTGSSSLDDLRLYVYFRNAHHLDPARFATRSQVLSSLIALAVVIFSRPWSRDWSLLDRWLIFINLAFVAGLIAWVLDFTPLLMTYPFRIAPVANLLAACVLVARRALDRKNDDGTVRRGVFVLAVSVWCILRGPVAGELWGFKEDWSRFVAGTDVSHSPVVSWFHTHTPSNSVLLLPPNKSALWFFTMRPQFVSFKYHPPKAMGEWMSRLTILNGGREFSKRGFSAMAELIDNYARLSHGDLMRMRHDFGVRYYVTVSKREDLTDAEVFRDPSYWVYDLALLASEL